MFNLGTESKETPLDFYEDTNIMVNFCIWVLQLDGLYVPPFDRHPERNGILRARGLNAEAWQSWLAKVVATKDQRLGGTLDPQEQQLWLEERLAFFEASAFEYNRKIDLPAIRTALEKSIDWQAQQYQEAFSQLGSFSRDSIPPDVWVGEPGVGDILGELWQDYLAMLEKRDNQWSVETEQVERTKPWRRLVKGWSESFNNWKRDINRNKLYKQLQKFRPNLVTLHVYQVDYLKPVEYLVPPVSIILSTANGLPGSKTYCKSVLRAAKYLVVINHSS